jgi:N-acetylmuramoyl-L-alanine amidase
MLTIAIDAGHGLYTAGKRCLKSIDSSETREWYLNDRIADKFEVMLNNYNCKVIRVDDTTGKTDISLSKRCSQANERKADVYISIHHDAGIKGGSGGGTTVYYYSNSDERKAQAKNLYECIVDATGLKGNRSNPVIKNGFYVLKNTNMDAFLIENGFMDSTHDTPIILTELHANKTVEGLVKFLVTNYGLIKLTNSSTENESTKKIHRVQVGAYSKKENAEAMQKKLKAAGYDAIIVEK